MGASGSRSTPEMLHSVTVLLPEPNRGPVDLEIIPLAETPTRSWCLRTPAAVSVSSPTSGA